MNDSQSIVEILIKFGLLDAQNADTALQKLQAMEDAQKDLNAEMGIIKVTNEDVTKATESNTDAVKEQGEAVEETGRHGANARLKHMALHHAISELNKVVPGLGTSLMMLERGFDGAGEAASGMGDKISAAITTIGPLIVILLSIQAVTEYWNLYQEKLKAVGEEQAKLAKDTQENTAAMLKSIKELDDALHPKKKDTGTKDEEELKQKKQGIEDAAAETAARNKKAESDTLAKDKKDEEALLAGATSEIQKEGIRKVFAEREEATKTYYKNLNDKNDESKLNQLAAADKAMQDKMNQQTATLDAKAHALAQSPAEKAAYAEEAGTDKFATGAQKQADAIKKRALMDAFGTLGASLFLPDVAGDIEGTIRDRQGVGGSKLKGIVGAVGGMATEATGIADKREGVDSELGTDAHKASETKRLNDIAGGRNPDQAAINQAAADLKAGWDALHKITQEAHIGTHKNISVLIQMAADQKAKNVEMANRLYYLETHHGT